MKELALKTANDVGDGTTTATLLAQSMYTEGLRLVAAGIDPMELQRGISSGEYRHRAAPSHRVTTSPRPFAAL